MKTNVGSVRYWDEFSEAFTDVELQLEDYNLIFYFPDGSSVESDIQENVEYTVEVDKEYDYTVYIRRSDGYSPYHFILLSYRNKKVELIKEHYDKLNKIIINRQKE